MRKPDLICVQPSHVDFPMWRHYLHKYRSYFNHIYVAFMNANHKTNLTTFINSELIKLGVTTIMDTHYLHGHDWRSSAVNRCLNQSTHEHLLFLEQDFIIYNDQFWETVLNQSSDLIGFKDSPERIGRLHPAFLLTTKTLLNQTSKNFSATAQHDHFGLVSEELEQLTCADYLEDLAPQQWKHMAGLTHNYSLVMNGTVPNYHVEEFKSYNNELLLLDVPQNSFTLDLIRRSC